MQGVLEQIQVIARAYALVRRFRQILTERDETALPSWAYEAETSQIPELMRFVQRLRLDWEAVENALLFTSSQGQVEGQVNRLKVFKRQKLRACKSCPLTGSVSESKRALLPLTQSFWPTVSTFVISAGKFIRAFRSHDEKALASCTWVCSNLE
ncbi:hypothetical protein KSC_104710 [Ktedonobacter sp. SOSP1-52]|nr:hypothetical protein KSC_104710 [Ktedonobacter sp. SOSP1-52]